MLSTISPLRPFSRAGFFQIFSRRILSTVNELSKVTQDEFVAPKPIVSKVFHPFPLKPLPPDVNISELALDKFAVIKFSGTQYKVAIDDLIVANRIENVDIGEKVEINEVLLIGSREMTYVGRPIIPGAKVITVVEEKVKDHKVIAFKKRRRKNSQRIRGHRRQLTLLRVQEILFE